MKMNHHLKNQIDWTTLSDERLKEILQVMLKITDKGGVKVIMEDDACITTYNVNSYNRKSSRTYRKQKSTH